MRTHPAIPGARLKVPMLYEPGSTTVISHLNTDGGFGLPHGPEAPQSSDVPSLLQDLEGELSFQLIIDANRVSDTDGAEITTLANAGDRGGNWTATTGPTYDETNPVHADLPTLNFDGSNDYLANALSLGIAPFDVSNESHLIVVIFSLPSTPQTNDGVAEGTASITANRPYPLRWGNGGGATVKWETWEGSWFRGPDSAPTDTLFAWLIQTGANAKANWWVPGDTFAAPTYAGGNTSARTLGAPGMRVGSDRDGGTQSIAMHLHYLAYSGSAVMTSAAFSIWEDILAGLSLT